MRKERQDGAVGEGPVGRTRRFTKKTEIPKSEIPIAGKEVQKFRPVAERKEGGTSQ